MKKVLFAGHAVGTAMLHYYLEYLFKAGTNEVIILEDDNRVVYKAPPKIKIEATVFPYYRTKADRRNECVPNSTQRHTQERYLRNKFKSQR